MATAVKAAELNPDLTTSAAAASSQSAQQRDKEKYSNLSDDESEQITKTKTKHIHRTKDASDDSSASASASSSNSNSPTFLDDPVARLKAVPRRSWVQLLVLALSLAVLFMAWHPTAYYRTQLYFGNCVEIPSRGGMVHKICPPQTIPHPLA